ncbi:hypothetical protein M8994_17285 [Brucella sp. 21LCYQ03]|nr:hypothetical protein [Brucella sp. 21LCYQ03]
MAVIKIEHIEITTKSGLSGMITGLQDDQDLLVGYVTTPALGNVRMQWNDYGKARNQTDQYDLQNNKEDDVVEAVDTAKKIFRR